MYFIPFTYDFRRKTWIYFLSEKSEAFEVLKKFKVHDEKESSCKKICVSELIEDVNILLLLNEFSDLCGIIVNHIEGENESELNMEYQPKKSNAHLCQKTMMKKIKNLERGKQECLSILKIMS